MKTVSRHCSCYELTNWQTCPFLVIWRELVFQRRTAVDVVTAVDIKIKGRYQLNIIDHLPTSNHTDEEVDAVYEDIDSLYTSSKGTTKHYQIIVRDFNAKIGFGYAGETCTGPFVYRTRNKRGNGLINSSEWHRPRLWIDCSRKIPREDGPGDHPMER